MITLFSVILKLLPSSKGTAPRTRTWTPNCYRDAFVPTLTLGPSWHLGKALQAAAPPYSGSVLPCTAPVGHDLEHLLLKTITEAVRASGFTQNEAPLPRAESKHGLGGQRKMLEAFCARLCC